MNSWVALSKERDIRATTLGRPECVMVQIPGYLQPPRLPPNRNGVKPFETIQPGQTLVASRRTQYEIILSHTDTKSI